jgi:hypothetical protein
LAILDLHCEFLFENQKCISLPCAEFFGAESAQPPPYLKFLNQALALGSQI